MLALASANEKVSKRSLLGSSCYLPCGHLCVLFLKCSLYSANSGHTDCTSALRHHLLDLATADQLRYKGYMCDVQDAVAKTCAHTFMLGIKRRGGPKRHTIQHAASQSTALRAIAPNVRTLCTSIVHLHISSVDVTTRTQSLSQADTTNLLPIHLSILATCHLQLCVPLWPLN